MNNDDFDLPVPVNDFYDDVNDLHPQNLETETRLPTKVVTHQKQNITEDDLVHLTLNTLDKKILLSELSDCDMYLKNIHNSFKAVTSTKSLISLVATGIGVHKHRRQVLTEVKNKQGATIEIDEHGNVKTN